MKTKSIMDYFWTRMAMTTLLRMDVIKHVQFLEVRDKFLATCPHAQSNFTSDMDLDQAVYAMYTKDEYKGITDWGFMYER